MGEPVWAIATFFPSQGDWSEEEYLALPTENHRVDFADGTLEVLPTPTQSHQAMVAALLVVLLAYARSNGGLASFSGLRVRLRPGKFREPDLVFMSEPNAARCHEEYWEGADLAIEVVSGGPEDRVRDLVTKRREYAAAGIPEYWIVDPEAEAITVLALVGGSYAEHGVFGRGAVARSSRWEGLEIAVSTLFEPR